MKDVAQPVEAQRKAADRARAPSRELRAPDPLAERARAAPARDPGGPSVLDHLRRARLAQRWEAATAEPAQALPGRADLERRLGASLAGVRVHSGPAARSLLDHLGARGAASGRVILLRDGGDAETAAHEAAHTVQSAGEGEPGAPVAADHPAEREAEAIARGRGPARVRVRLRVGALALRRANDATPVRADPTASPRIKTESLAYEPLERGVAGGDKVLHRARAPPEEKEAQEQQAADPEALVPEEPAGEDGGAAAGREPPSTEEPVAAPRAEPGPDRQAEVRAALEDSQAVWDKGAVAAGGHAVETCSGQANQPGAQAFARGPPLDVPETREAPAVADPELEPVDKAELARAESALEAQIAKAPARGPPVDSSGLDEDQRKERDRHRAELKAGIEKQVGDTTRTSALERLERTDAADPARAKAAEADAAGRVQAAEEAAQRGAQEDFGEEKLAPETDPTEGHDRGLEALEVPEVDVASLIDQGGVARIGTRANAGALPLDEVVLVQDRELEAEEQALQAQRAAEQEIDGSIAASEDRLRASCETSSEKRAELRSQAETGVQARRDQWQADASQHVAAKRVEAAALTQEKVAHADQLEQEANKEAGQVLTDADGTAQGKLQETTARAQEKAKESEDKSWWQQGVDAIKSVLKDIAAWIGRFIEDCHKAVDALLDAARSVAHAIVEAGHAAISATLDALRDGLDLIADNLPGELGRLAREHREGIHAFLDGAQGAVDGWAQGLHAAIDAEIEEVRADLHGNLDALQEDVRKAAAALDDILAHGLMAFLRAGFPVLAALLDEGLNAPIQRAADQLGAWVGSALESSGLAGLKAQVDELHDETLCQPETEEEQAEACAAFQKKLDAASREIGAFLSSPFVTSLRGFFQGKQDEQASQQVDAVSSFFEFIRWVAKPVYDWWQGVKPVVESALDALGDIAQGIWRHIALALGIDPDLSPLEALTQGLEALWEAVSKAVEPLVQGIKDAWHWVRDEGPLAPVFDFFAKLPDAWNRLKDFASQAAGSAEEWLAKQAQELAQVVLPPLNAALALPSRAAHAAVDALESYVGGVIGALDAVLSFQAAHELVQALVIEIALLLTPLRLALKVFKDCVIRGLRFLADALDDLRSTLGKLLDIAAGLAFALATFPVGLVAFLAGNVWLHVVPDCYKASILNFLLDLALQFLRLLPEPADVGLGILYNALVNFLVGLRQASDAQKVGAVNLFASLYAGNAEIAAGLIVGLAEGVWEGTGGTIIFLLQAVAWVLMLPFQLARWAVGMITGKLTGGEEGGGAQADAAVQEAEPEEQGGGAPEGRGPATVEESEEVEEVDRRPEVGEIAEEELGAEPVAAPEGDRPKEELVRELRGAPARTDAPEQASELLAGEPEAALDVEAGAELEAEAPGAGGETAEDVEQPPPAPAELSGFRSTLERFMAEGFTREDVQKALDAARAGLRNAVGKVAQEAAVALLGAINAKGAGFAIGRTIGALLGQILVEILIAFFTSGAGAAVSAAKGALAGGRVTAKFAGVIKKVRKALEPALELLSKLRGVLGEILGAIRKWFDDVLRWMKGIAKRAKGKLKPKRGHRPRGPGRPRGGRRGPGRKGPKNRPHRGDGPDGPERKGKPKGDKDKDTHKDRDGEKRTRLRRAVNAMEPKLRRMLDDGISRIRLLAQLKYWQVRYRLSGLSIVGAGKHFQFLARLNPAEKFGNGFHEDRDEVYRMVQQIGAKRYERARKRAEELGMIESLGKDKTAILPKGEDPSVLGAAMRERDPGDVPMPKGARGTQLTQGAADESTTLTFLSPDGVRTFGIQKRGIVNVVIAGLGKYPEIAAKFLKHKMNGQAVADAVFKLISTGRGHPDPDINKDVMRLTTLVFGTEVARSSTAAATAGLTLAGLASGKVTREEAFDLAEGGEGRRGGGGLFPPSQEGFVGSTKRAEARIGLEPELDREFRTGTHRHEDSEETINRTIALVQKLVAGMDFDDRESLQREIELQLELVDKAFRTGEFLGG